MRDHWFNVQNRLSDGTNTSMMEHRSKLQAISVRYYLFTAISLFIYHYLFYF